MSLLVSLNERFHTHNVISVREFCDSTARVLDPEITQLAKGTISQINDITIIATARFNLHQSLSVLAREKQATRRKEISERAGNLSPQI